MSEVIFIVCKNYSHSHDFWVEIIRRQKVWILCPTCHALLDRKGHTPKQLGLVGDAI